MRGGEGMPGFDEPAERAWTEYWGTAAAIGRFASTGSRRVPLELSERAFDAYERARALDRLAKEGVVDGPR